MVFDFIFSIILRQTDKWVTKNWSFESISQIKSENGELSQVFIFLKSFLTPEFRVFWIKRAWASAFEWLKSKKVTSSSEWSYSSTLLVRISESSKFFRRIPWRKIGYYVLWFSGISYTCYNIIEHFTTYRTYPSIITQASFNLVTSMLVADVGDKICWW